MAEKVEQPMGVISNNGTNGAHTANGHDAVKASRFDPAFTDAVINATGPKATPRLRKVMASLTRHLHDFCRENEITIDEYMAGVEMVRIGTSTRPDVA